jgi:cardiolipin synthase
MRLPWYDKGFMHQKIVLIDEDYATVGTANFDNRSFRLNFEITVVVADHQGSTARWPGCWRPILPAADCWLTEADIRAKGPLFRFAVRAAQLTAPIQ